MNRILLTTGLVAVALLGVDHLQELQSRVAELERAPQVQPEFVRELSREIASLRADLAEAGELRESDDTIENIEGALGGGRLDAGARALPRGRASRATPPLGEPLERPRAGGDRRAHRGAEHRASAARQAELEELRNLNSQIAEQDQQRFDQLKSKVEPLLQSRDRERMWHDLVGPWSSSPAIRPSAAACCSSRARARAAKAGSRTC
jgi:DNA repair exonuclease SbcCD ATPase subunit